MSCLFCKNFQALEPEDHRREREARTCEFTCGNRWDAFTAARYVKRHKKFLVGACHLNPKSEGVHCSNICAKFEDGFYSHWHIGQPGERDNLADWAAETMQTFIHGDREDQERDRLAEENKTLKRALKVSRQRSAARLAKLNKVARKEQAKPVPLRLVAAE